MYEVSKEPEGATPLFCFVATQKNNQKTQKSIDNHWKRVYNININ